MRCACAGDTPPTAGRMLSVAALPAAAAADSVDCERGPPWTPGTAACQLDRRVRETGHEDRDLRPPVTQDGLLWM
jgi:hypothetical protein